MTRGMAGPDGWVVRRTVDQRDGRTRWVGGQKDVGPEGWLDQTGGWVRRTLDQRDGWTREGWLDQRGMAGAEGWWADPERCMSQRHGWNRGMAETEG